MGIIIKQGIKGTIWSYSGLIIGYINLGIIMPHFFSADKIGLISLFIASSTIFVQFSTLGFNRVTDRLFPYFRNKKKNHNGFLFLIFAVGIIGFTVATIVFFLFKPQLIESKIDRSPLIAEYFLLLLPIIFFKLIFSLLSSYNKVLLDATTQVFWSEFMHRIFNLLLIIGVAMGWIQFQQYLYAYIVSVCFPVIPLIFVLIKRGDFNFRPDIGYAKKYAKEMFSISAYGLFNGFSGRLVTNLDKLLVNHYLSLELLGIYSVCSIFARVIRIPSNSVNKIATGIIAQSWKTNDLKHIQEIYYKASINQMVTGLLIFIGILVNIDTIFEILPKAYDQGKWVVIIYSFGVLIRTTNGINGTIIATSSHYKVLTYFVFLTFAITIGSNFVLIPAFGIIGAACATALTLILNSSAKFLFVRIKFGMNCYGIKHIYILIIGAGITLIGFMLPSFESWLLTFIFKSSIISLLYILLIWKLKVSEEINNLVDFSWQYVIKQIKRIF